MAKTVLVPIGNGSEELEAVTIINVLRRAGAQVIIASVESGLQITASRKTQIVADVKISDCAGKSFDCIALPGGMPGAERLRDSVALIELLKQQHKAGKWIAAICAAPAVVLAHHHLLDGHKATCYPAFQPELPDRTAAANRVVVDGHFITSQGPGTAMEFVLSLVEALYGIDHKKQVAEPMLIA
jgi:4-methyl-5(b-hydroxyethyl)-thiazole monophosphate biosynthesis